MALVRNQLERMSRDKRVGTTTSSKANRSGQAPATGKSRLQALSNLSDLPDDEFERLLVAALLSREFGEDVAQDPRFQSVVDRTWKILRDDAELRTTIAEVRRGLKDRRDSGLDR
jgi:hypothetical protein